MVYTHNKASQADSATVALFSQKTCKKSRQQAPPLLAALRSEKVRESQVMEDKVISAVREFAHLIKSGGKTKQHQSLLGRSLTLELLK